MSNQYNWLAMDRTGATFFVERPVFIEKNGMMWCSGSNNPTEWKELFPQNIPQFIKRGQLWERKWFYDANYTKHDGTQQLFGAYVWELVEEIQTDTT